MAQRIGLRAYSGQEAGNLALGQNGFDVLDSSTSFGGGGQSAPTGLWIAIKALGTASDGLVTLMAYTKTGDNLTDDGSTGMATLVAGDIIYGPFERIANAGIGSGEALICYRG